MTRKRVVTVELSHEDVTIIRKALHSYMMNIKGAKQTMSRQRKTRWEAITSKMATIQDKMQSNQGAYTVLQQLPGDSEYDFFDQD